MQYACYKENELLNKPHNIIRHKDMPKTVFKLLWDYIENKKEIFAFVKNRNKNGDFYWVFANISPSYNLEGKLIGYYSVRRKPNPNAIKIISEIYTKMLEIEKIDGMQGGVKMIENLCTQTKKSYNQIIFDMQLNQ